MVYKRSIYYTAYYRIATLILHGVPLPVRIVSGPQDILNFVNRVGVSRGVF
jgi:hypothetical protein